MGDKDMDELFGNSELLICEPNGEIRSLGRIVERSVSFESEEELPCKPGRDSYSIDCKADIDDDTREVLFPKALRTAESMREEINDFIKTYGFLRREGKLNRRERREREREIKQRLGRFKTFCKENNIQYDIQK